MSTYERVADLPLTIDGYALDKRWIRKRCQSRDPRE